MSAVAKVANAQARSWGLRRHAYNLQNSVIYSLHQTKMAETYNDAPQSNAHAAGFGTNRILNVIVFS